MLTDAALPALISQEMQVWKARLGELQVIVARETVEMESLKAKIAAGETLLGNASSGNTKETNLADDIKKLMKDGQTRTPKMMRRDLIKAGVSPELVSSRRGNLYNVIFRLTNRRWLLKVPPNKYEWNKLKQEDEE
jgi:hypothetical protein